MLRWPLTASIRQIFLLQQALLYQLTGDKYYADEAAKAIQYTLQCQRTEPLNDKNKTRGFFYRDLTKKSIVHYTHQSRDQVYMQALTVLCETQPNHADYKKWEASIKMYGEYLKTYYAVCRTIWFGAKWCVSHR